MLLTTADRQKFIAWLRRDIESSKALLEQMNKLPSVVNEAMKSHLLQEMNAEIIVLRKLESVEEQTIGGA